MASFGGGGGGFEPASLKILKVEKREDECCCVVEAIELAHSRRTDFAREPLSTHFTFTFRTFPHITF